MAAVNSYVRRMSWLKVTLLFLALAILSTLFLFASGRQNPANLPFATGAQGEAGSGQRLGNAVYSGVSAAGARITLHAGSAVTSVGGSRDVVVSDLTARIVPKSGTPIDLRADSGVVAAADRPSLLSGDVRITGLNGFALVAPSLSVTGDLRQLAAEEGVQMSGPGVSITAARMQAELDGTAPEGDLYTVQFTGGVKVVYDPGQDE